MDISFRLPRKTIAILLAAVLLIVFVCPANAYAASTTIKTSSLKSGATLTLTKDTTLNIDKSVTIKAIVGEEYNLTIKGSKTLTIENSSGPAIDVGSMTVESGKIVAKSSADDNAAVLVVYGYVQDGGTVNISSTSTTSGIGLFEYGGGIEINDGTFSAVVKGAEGYGIMSYDSYAEINGGTVSVAAACGIYGKERAYVNDGKVNITLTGENGAGIVSDAQIYTHGGTIVIDGSNCENAIGIGSSGGYVDFKGGDVTINDALSGIYMENGTLVISSKTINIESSVENAVGIEIHENAQASMNGGEVNISVPGDTGCGIYLEHFSFSISGGTLNILQSGLGIYGPITSYFDAVMNVRSTGDDSYGIYAGGVGFYGGNIKISAEGKNSTGIYIDEGSIIFKNDPILEASGTAGAIYPDPDLSGHWIGGAYVNSTASATGRTVWDGETALSSYKYVSIPGPDRKIPVINSIVNNGSDSGIEIKWTAGEAYTKFRVQRRIEGESNWTTLSSSITEKSYVDSTASVGGETYYYRVCGYYDSKWYDYSEESGIIRNPFKDVYESASYFKALMWAYNNGIVAGTSTTAFSPNANCTRGQFALMLWRMNGKPSIKGMENPFTDVPSTNGFYKGIVWCYNKGITAGTSATTYSPNDNIKRWQMILMFWRMQDKPASSLTSNPFTDVKTTASYYKAALWAYEKGITGVKEFKPNDLCTRWQLVLFLYRLNNLYHYI